MDVLITIAFILSCVFLKWKYSSNYKKLPTGPPGLPFIGNLVNLIRAENMSVVVHKWAETYGKIFSFRLGGKVMIVLSEYDLVVKALHHPQMQGRDPFITVTKAVGTGTGIVDAYGEIWKQQRLFIMNVFRSYGVGKSMFERVVAKEGNCLVKNLIHCTDSAKLGVLLSMASCNIISGISLGIRRDYEDPEFSRHQETIRKLVGLQGPGAVFSFSKLFCSIPFGPSKQIIDMMKDQAEWFRKVIMEHKANLSEIKSEDHSDFVYAYLHKMKSLPVTKDETFNEVNLIRVLLDLYNAGTETTSGAILWAVLFFMIHPDIQEACWKEIDSVLGRHGQVKFTDRTSLPFVMATIEEVLRMAVQASLGVIHRVETDVDFEGYDIPKGSYILYNNYSLCRNETYWNKPLEFNPYRYLNEDGKCVKQKEALVFGSGKRSCLGEELARMEMFFWITTILQNLEIKCPQNYTPPDFRDAVGSFLRLPLPFKVQLTRRIDET